MGSEKRLRVVQADAGLAWTGQKTQGSAQLGGELAIRCLGNRLHVFRDGTVENMLWDYEMAMDGGINTVRRRFDPVGGNVWISDDLRLAAACLPRYRLWSKSCEIRQCVVGTTGQRGRGNQRSTLVRPT